MSLGAGLGEETVRVLANAGARVTICCRKVEDGDRVAAAIKAAGAKVSPFRIQRVYPY